MCKTKLYSSISQLTNVFVFLFLMITVVQVRPIYAFSIDIITSEPSLFEVSIYHIQEGDQNKVYTVDPERGTVTFGDGEPGSRLPVGSGEIIASYSRGGGASGNVPDGIFNTYTIPTDFSPFPLRESFFSVYHNGNTDYSFLLSGISSLELGITSNRMWINNVTPAPEPATLSLMLAGLACLAAFVHIRRKINHSSNK